MIKITKMLIFNYSKSSILQKITKTMVFVINKKKPARYSLQNNLTSSQLSLSRLSPYHFIAITLFK
jgi:hypothetical protein